MNESLTLTRNSLIALPFLFQMTTYIAGLTIPVYATLLGATPLIVGFIGAIGGALYSFMPAVSGMLSDRFGRKNFIALSTLLYSASCLLYSLVEDPYAFMPIKALESFSMALFWPSLEALLAETCQSDLERILRTFNLSWGSGMMVGPAVGGFLISAFGAKASLIISSIISLTLFIITIVWVREARGKRVPSIQFKMFKFGWRRLSSLMTAALSTFLFSFSLGIMLNIFPAYASSIGLPPHEIGLMIFSVGLLRLIAFLKAYQIESLVGRTNMFLMGFTLMASALVLVAAGHVILLVISLSIFGFSIGLLYAASIASFLEDGRGEEGHAAGIFESLIGFGYFLGPLFGGIAAELSPGAPYILASLLAASTSVFCLYLRQKRHKKEGDML